ncbi:MAG: LacI family DNA-binding transcriptional regulator [Anaerolineales bacterium]
MTETDGLWYFVLIAHVYTRGVFFWGVLHTCADQDFTLAVTIKDIARLAGVSHPTVSRALRDDPVVAEKTASRIKQIAAELGYVPSAAARSLKTRQSHVLGVIVNRIADPFYGEVLDGIQEVLHAHDYSLFLAASDSDAEREKSVIRIMSERRVDGIIVCSTFVSKQRREQLSAFGAPVVVIHNREDKGSPFSIYHDDRYGSRQLIRHLIDLGHRRIAFLGNARGGRTSEERLAGFKEEMSAAGLSVPIDYIAQAPDGRLESGLAGTRAFLALPHPPTAVACFNDMTAIGALKTFQQAGLHVPADCSVVGFDNISLAALVSPPLTTFDQPKYPLGHKAAQMMLGLLGVLPERMPEMQSDILTLRGKLIVRASTAPPPEM